MFEFFILIVFLFIVGFIIFAYIDQKQGEKIFREIMERDYYNKLMSERSSFRIRKSNRVFRLRRIKK